MSADDQHKTRQVSSTILQTAMRLILPLALLFAAYSWLKGHNAPGGGFIAGLIASIAICMYRMSNGPGALYKMMPIHPRWIVFTGLCLAVITAIVPVVFGEPLLRSGDAYVYLGKEKLHLVSAMGFDTGVLLVVIGVSVGMITRLSEELED